MHRNQNRMEKLFGHGAWHGCDVVPYSVQHADEGRKYVKYRIQIIHTLCSQELPIHSRWATNEENKRHRWRERAIGTMKKEKKNIK